MILNKLRIKDFRQFRGVQEIAFATRDHENERNVTVIFGENGRGKTGIFRAIMFCLFGERRLSQDENVAIGELFLVNSAAIQEATIKKAGAVETFVEIEFEHKDERYRVRRKILGMLEGGERIEQIDSVLLSHWRRDGNTENLSDPDDINRIIGNILNSKVKEYFLFDGEKIQRLTLASVDQRREVAKGIRNLLGIEALEKAIKSVQKLCKNLNAELSKKATGEYGKVIYQLDNIDEKRTAARNRLAQLDDEAALSEVEKKKIDQKLEEFKEILYLLKDRENIEGALKSEEEQARNLMNEMKTKTGKASLLLISATIDNVFNLIDQKKQKGEIPSEIRKDLIERILVEKKCICGRGVSPGTEPFNEIILWKNRAADTEIDNSALEIWRYLGSVKGHKDDISVAIETLLIKYGTCRNAIENLRHKTEDINKQIGESERNDAAALEYNRENIKRKQVILEAERTGLLNELNSLDSEYKQLSDRRKLLEQQEGIKNEISHRVKIAEDTYEALQNIYQHFTDEVKKEITKEANQYFSELLDREGRETLRDIVVKDDYSLQIYDRWGKPFLANISAGQRQVMSISFIAALARVAAQDETLDMPLFMDTPFSRLSLEHRKNLVEKLPTFAAQLIALVTDTEFRRQEAILLRNSGKWGKFYLLQGSGPGSTTIQERNIDDVQSMLLENAEA